MGNKASVPAQERQRVIAHKYSLFEHIPHDSVVQSLTIQTANHKLHSVCIDVGTPVFVKEYKDTPKVVKLKLFGLADFPLFLMDAKKEVPSITVMVLQENDKPMDVKIVPKFRPVLPEEYSMIRHSDLQFPVGDTSGFSERWKKAVLVFRAKDREGCLQIRPV
jgi:hypothetical protein